MTHPSWPPGEGGRVAGGHDAPAGHAEPDAPAGHAEPDAPAGHAEPDAPAGHPAVDAALRAIAQVADAPPADQIPAYQAAHRTLQETLTSIDEG
jgi:hypothetical protein